MIFAKQNNVNNGYKGINLLTGHKNIIDTKGKLIK